MKKIATVIALFFLTALFFGLYQYSRAPVNLKNQKAEVILSAIELKEQLAADTSVRNNLSGKVLLVEGLVSSVEEGEHPAIILDATVRGELEKSTAVPKSGEKVRLKGMLGGYDEIFEEVVLIKCQIEE
ncbi:hypothetical protein [Rufibacter tibetensis]|uniref:tRNA_anti-like n=1 Tax=Rufibacter tibetensis TaxID=512763 RepID=A0A0P0C5J2_9BACT|nr:hypothetical protein [Rufibacter tibetensis]ALJ00459.1 hypothetical protein DC20_17645 [Rufibacter tibetensis]